MRVLLHTGKGGVGKTTAALATAFGAARHGHRVCVLSTDPAHSLSDALGLRVGPTPKQIHPSIVAREIRAQSALDDSWVAIQTWLRGLVRDEANALVAEELIAFPGIEELIALRAIREVAESGEFDVCVVDCAPTGATLRMLRFPDALRVFMANFFEIERRGARLLRPLVRGFSAGRVVPEEAFFEAFETLYESVEGVAAILLDETRTSARLVVNPARVVVAETRRAFAYLSLYGVAVDAVLVNRVTPLSLLGGYFTRWIDREQDALAEIHAGFPVAIHRAALQPSEPIGQAALESLAEELFGDQDPATRLTSRRPLEIVRDGEWTSLRVAVPGIESDEIDVVVKGSDLHLRVRDAQRAVPLPDSLVGRPVLGVVLEEGILEVRFGDD